MDRKLFLHAGAPKTGTSALQVALARNRDVLFRQGIVYPKSYSDKAAERGLITSGNGNLLSHLWREDRGTDKMNSQLSALSRVLNKNQRHDVLYSSEAISKSSLYRISRLREFAAAEGYQLKVIYYVRHLLDAALSLHNQFARGGWIKDRSQFLNTFVHRYHLVVDGFARTVGAENLIVKLYDNEKKDLAKGFFSTFGDFDFRPLPLADSERINRSLTPEEVCIVMRVNVLLSRVLDKKNRKKLSRHLTEDIIQELRPRGPKAVVTPSEYQKFSENNQGVLNSINRFTGGKFQLKMSSGDIVIDERKDEPFTGKDLVFMSIIETLLERFLGGVTASKKRVAAERRESVFSSL